MVAEDLIAIYQSIFSHRLVPVEIAVTEAAKLFLLWKDWSLKPLGRTLESGCEFLLVYSLFVTSNSSHRRGMLAPRAHRTKTHLMLLFEKLTCSHFMHLLAMTYDGRDTNVTRPSHSKILEFFSPPTLDSTCRGKNVFFSSVPMGTCSFESRWGGQKLHIASF